MNKIPKGYVLIKETDYQNLLQQLASAFRRIEELEMAVFVHP